MMVIDLKIEKRVNCEFILMLIRIYNWNIINLMILLVINNIADDCLYT